MTTENITVPAPFILTPSGKFDGDDGSWSTFNVELGTPSQSFRVLPATVGEELWIPVTEGCDGVLKVLEECGDMRGANAGRGFDYEASSSWKPFGPYTLSSSSSTDETLYGGIDTGLYALDSVGLGTGDSGAYTPISQAQVVAGINTENFWLGSVGLGTSPHSFSDGAGHPSLLVSMKEQNLVSSLSYSYTAGRSYGVSILPLPTPYPS